MGERILVVDDEPHIRTVLRAYLQREGFDIAEASAGTEALREIGRRGFDLVLLDLGLPGMDGIEVLRKVRASSEVPVIVLTARAEEGDKILGLNVGADDYVTKPFSAREVVARVHSVLRRSRPKTATPAPEESSVLGFDGLVIDIDRREIAVDGVPVVLSSLEFDLLVAMAKSPGRVFSRGQLLERVWGYDFYGDERVVDVHIRSMRAALGDDAASPRFLATVRGYGYKFAGTPAP